MATDDVNHPTAESLERMTQTAWAQLLWMLAKVVVTAFVSGSIAMGVGYVRDMRNEVMRVGQQLTRQDKAQALTEQRVDDLKQVSDATVVTLRQLGEQVTHNTDAIQQIEVSESRRGRR